MQEELNPGNEALTQLRDHWQTILLFTMHKLGVKEIILDADDMAAAGKASPPGEHPFLVVIGRKQLGPNGGVKLVLAYSQAEMLEIMSKAQGQG